MAELVAMSAQANHLIESDAMAQPLASVTRQPSKQDLELAAQLIGHAQGRVDSASGGTGAPQSEGGSHDDVQSNPVDADQRRRQTATDATRALMQAESLHTDHNSRDVMMEDNMTPQDNAASMNGQICR